MEKNQNFLQSCVEGGGMRSQPWLQESENRVLDFVLKGKTVTWKVRFSPGTQAFAQWTEDVCSSGVALYFALARNGIKAEEEEEMPGKHWGQTWRCTDLQK